MASINLECQGCGKALSLEQVVSWYEGAVQMRLCLDCVFWARSRPEETARVNVSVDLLERLRDGLL